jgi:serine O-acetyltransferase
VDGRVDSPVVGDDVSIGAGARVIGAVTVGPGATIGANAVVLQDVPAGALAVGVPARIVDSRGRS